MNHKAFENTLKGDDLDNVEIVRRHLLHGTPHCFRDNEEKYYDLKRVVSNHFQTHPEFVRIVGSAKLGFSIAPNKLWNSFDEDSDIDLVIVSESLFTKFWMEVADFRIDVMSRSEYEDAKFLEFKDYLLRGWIRPDLFPFKMTLKSEWFEFFKGISYDRYGPYKIAGAIFYNFDMLEKYHVHNIANIRQQVRRDG